MDSAVDTLQDPAPPNVSPSDSAYRRLRDRLLAGGFPLTRRLAEGGLGAEGGAKGPEKKTAKRGAKKAPAKKTAKKTTAKKGTAKKAAAEKRPARCSKSTDLLVLTSGA